MEWADVITQPDFQDLNGAEQGLVRERWVNEVYAPKLKALEIPDTDIEGLKTEALDKFDNGQGYISSFASSAARGALGTVSSAIQGAGALLDAPDLEGVGTSMQESTEDTFNVNPSLTKTNFTGNVLGNLGGVMASGGTLGTLGKALGAAKAGAQAGYLGTSFFAGAGGAAQEADQYGITGEDRRLKAFIGGATEVISEKIPFLGGMTPELRAMSKIPGLGKIANERTGGLVTDIGQNALEEGFAQVGGNLTTIALAPEGVQGPGVFEGSVEALAGGAIGGVAIGGINLIGAPPAKSQQVATIAAERAAAAGDPEAAAVIAEAAANVSTRLVPVTAPEVTPIAEPDQTTEEEIDFDAYAAENPLIEIPNTNEQELPEPPLAETPQGEEIEDTVAGTGIDGAISSPARLDADVPDILPDAPDRPTALKQQAETIFFEPEVKPTFEVLAQEAKLIDRQGRLTEEAATGMFNALRELGVSQDQFVINNTGVAEGQTGGMRIRGSRDIVNGRGIVSVNRNEMTADTPMHEAIGHGVLPVLRTANPELFSAGAALFQDSPLMEDVKARYERNKMEFTPEVLLEETMATAYGNDSADFWKTYAKNGQLTRQIKQWIAKFRVWLEDHLASKGIDPNMTAGDFAKKVNRRILAGSLRQGATTNSAQISSLPVVAQGTAQAAPEASSRENSRTKPREDLQTALDYMNAAQVQAGKSRAALTRDANKIKFRLQDEGVQKDRLAHPYYVLSRPASQVSRPEEIAEGQFVFSAQKLQNQDIFSRQMTPLDRGDQIKDALYPGAKIEKDGNTYRVTPNVSGGGLRLTKFDNNDLPTGHVTIGGDERVWRTDLEEMVGGVVFGEAPAQEAAQTTPETPVSAQETAPFSESLLATLPEQSRKAWTPEALAAADAYGESGDRAAIAALNPVQQKRVREHRENLRKPLGPQFSINPTNYRKSGLAANAPGTRINRLASEMTYEEKTVSEATTEAAAYFEERRDLTFPEHMAFVDELKANLNADYQVMTFAAYAGMLGESLTEVQDDTSLPEVDRAYAENQFMRLVEKMKDFAAASGQAVKAFDIFQRFANNPVMQVRSDEQLLPFNQNVAERKRFDEAKADATRIAAELNREALANAPQEKVETAMGQRVAAQIAGEDATDAAGAALEVASEPALAAADEAAVTTEEEWFKQAEALLGTEVKAIIDNLLFEELLQIALRSRGASFSLASQEALNERVQAELARIGSDPAALSAALKQSEARKKALTAKLKGVKPKALATKKPASEDDVKGMVVGRFSAALDRLINSGTKNQPTVKQKIAKAITNGLLGKVGVDVSFGTDADSMVTALAMLIANKDIASSAVLEIQDALQKDPETRDALPPEKLKALMQLGTGQDFAAEGKPYGDRQIAELLRAELKRQEVKLGDVVMDSALLRETREQLEARLRDPARGFDKTMTPATLNKVVQSVLIEFDRTAKQRTERILNEMVDQRARDRMAEDKRQEMEYAKLLERQAKRNLQELEKKARDAAKAEQRALAKQEREEIAAQEKIVREMEQKVRDAMAAQTREVQRNEAYVARLRREARRAARKGGQAVPLDLEEWKKLRAQKPEKVIDFLAREYGFDVKEAVKIVRDGDRRAGIEKMTEKLADQLGLTKTQAEKVMKPVIAEAMGSVDAARKKQAEKQITDAIARALRKQQNLPKKPGKTEAQRLIELAELGGLTLDNVEQVMLSNRNAMKFSPELRQQMIDLIATANDASLPQQARDIAYQRYLETIRSLGGIGVLGLWGELISANIFGGISTQKVNIFWGFMKQAVDSTVYVAYSGPASIIKAYTDAGKPIPPGLRRIFITAYLRGMRADMQQQAAYIWNTGLTKVESDFTTVLGNSYLELLGNMPATEIRWTQNGTALPATLQSAARSVASVAKYVRRLMVFADIANRTPAWEMMKKAYAMKALIETDVPIPKDAASFRKLIEDVQYGGSIEQAREEVNKQIADEIAAGTLNPREEGVRFSALMDERMGQSIGLPAGRRTEGLEQVAEEAKRITNADTTQGVFGALTTNILAFIRDAPGLSKLVPAVRMPINAFSQTLDWTPWGLYRLYAAHKSGKTSSSVTNLWWNNDWHRPTYYRPKYGITEERIADLRAKALFGSACMILLCFKVANDWEEDEDKADFYITGKGPENPAQRKLWMEKGYKPFMMRLFGVSVAYQESPIYAMLAPIGAWSDAKRYGPPGAEDSEKFAYAFTQTVTGFKDAVVLKNLADVAGSASYGAASQLDATAKWTSRLGSVAISPRIFGDMNQILYGPQDPKGLSYMEKFFANIPFYPSLNNKPALNFFGEELHKVRGDDAWGEAVPMLAHRITHNITDDQQMKFVSRFKANVPTTTRKLKTGSEVSEDYDLMRRWHANSGKAIRAALTPAKMAQLETLRAKDKGEAEESFDKFIREIRLSELKKFKEVKF